MSDCVGPGFELRRFLLLFLLLLYLQGIEVTFESKLETLLGTERVSGRSRRTICSQRLIFTAPRSSSCSLNGSGFVGSSFFFSGRTTVLKSGSGWALNCGTWKEWKTQEV